MMMKSLFALILSAITVSGVELEVSNWLTPESGDPAFPHMAAEVGDSILFNWPEGQIIDVHIHPTGTCDEFGSILVGYLPGSSYTFTEEDGGKEIFFACDVGRRCEVGQNIKVKVLEPPPEAQISGVEEAVSAATTHRSGMVSALALTAGFAATVAL